MTLYLALDPGPAHTGVIVIDVRSDAHHEIAIVHAESEVANEELRRVLLAWRDDGLVFGRIGIETIRHTYGTSVGADVLDTAWWAGRFHETANALVVEPSDLVRASRKAAVQSAQAYGRLGTQPKGARPRSADAQVRADLIAAFGGESALGSKHAPGPLYGVTGHAWQALAVGIHLLGAPARPLRPLPRRTVVGGLWGVGPSFATSVEHEPVSVDHVQRQESV